MKVKVCGITSVAQLGALQSMGADYAGFIFYQKSARYAGEKLEAHQKEIGTFAIQKVGVFVNEELEEVKRKIRRFHLAAVQLHGDEDAPYCKELMQHTQVIKVFRLKDDTDIEKETAPFMDASHYFLFDTDTKDYGGSGRQFNWNVLQSAAINKPFFLSGGIGADDVEKIKAFQHPFLYGVDVNSRFEVAPGIKKMDVVQQFLKDVKEV